MTRKRILGSFRLCFAGALAVLVTAGSGCIDTTYLVLLQPDGSGTISYQCEATDRGMAQFTETIGLLSMMGLVDEAEIAYSLGLSSGELTPQSLRELYTKQSMTQLARSLGQGVELLRYQAVRGAGKQGFRALYRYQDINQLRLGPGGDPSAGGPDWHYGFSFVPGSPSTLRLVPPARLSGYSAESTASSLDAVIEGMQMMPNADGFVNHLFTDGHVRIAVQVPGEVVSGSEHVSSGNTVVLAEVDANRVPGGSTILKLLSVKQPADLMALYESRTPGVKLIHPTQGMKVQFQ